MLLLGGGGGIPGDRAPGRELEPYATCGRTCGAMVGRVNPQLTAPLPSSRSPLPPLFLCMTCSLSSAALSTACLYVSFESAQPIRLHRACHETSCMWSSCHSQLDSTEPLRPDLHPTSHSTSDRFLLSVESVHDWVFSVCLLTVVVFECYRQPMSDRW